MKIQLRLLACIIGNLLLFSACVQKEHVKEVTFMVDMRGVDNVSTVVIRGQFTSPPWEVTLPMSDENNDGIYETTLEEPTAQSSVSFKFVINEDQFELEGQPNRTVQFQYRPEVIVYSGIFDDPNGKQNYK